MLVVIMGLGETGIRIGQAHKQLEASSEIIGYDPLQERLESAHGTGLFQVVTNSLEDLIPNCSRLIYCLPEGSTEGQYRYIGERLSEDSIMLDLSSPSQQGLAWASSHLNPGSHYLHATLNLPRGGDRERGYRAGVLGLVVPAGTPDWVVDWAEALADELGAQTFFLQPGESDSARVVGEALPALLSAALLHSVANSPGWPELQRLVSEAFLRVTLPDDQLGPSAAADLLTENPEIALAKIRAFQSELKSLETSIREGQGESLAERLRASREIFHAWQELSLSGDWSHAQDPAPDSSRPGFLRTLLGLGRREDRPSD